MRAASAGHSSTERSAAMRSDDVESGASRSRREGRASAVAHEPRIGARCASAAADSWCDGATGREPRDSASEDESGEETPKTHGRGCSRTGEVS